MIQILNPQEKQEILMSLKEQFGIISIPGILIKIGGERIFLFQGSLNEKQIKNLEATVPIERTGIYFAKIQGGNIRLSIDGTHLLKDQIKNNVFELNEKQMQEWMSGNEILLNDKDKLVVKDKASEQSKPNGGRVGWGAGGGKELPKGFVIMKYKDDFLGTGKASENKITNFIPKSRRLKNKD